MTYSKPKIKLVILALFLSYKIDKISQIKLYQLLNSYFFQAEKVCKTAFCLSKPFVKNALFLCFDSKEPNQDLKPRMHSGLLKTQRNGHFFDCTPVERHSPKTRSFSRKQKLACNEIFANYFEHTSGTNFALKSVLLLKF